MLPSSAFEVGGVQGGVESLAVACHRKKAEQPFRPSLEITIPATWGGCMVTIRGEPATTFTLYEFHWSPSPAPVTPAPIVGATDGRSRSS